jgi:hypothetical protein
VERLCFAEHNRSTAPQTPITGTRRAHGVRAASQAEHIVLDWQGWNRLRARIGGQFHAVFDAVAQAMAQTPRSSTLIENLNSRLQNYFTLRRQLGGSYLDLLQFFLNHRCFLRSRVPERVGKSPTQLMGG